MECTGGLYAPHLLESIEVFSRRRSDLASLLAHAGVVVVVVAVTAAAGNCSRTSAKRGSSSSSLPTGWTSRPADRDLQGGGPAGTWRTASSSSLRGHAGPGRSLRCPGAGQAERGPRELPFGPVPYLVPDTVFSVLEVDQMVERYEGSAAPAYPTDLPAMGTEGSVRAMYVVDTTGRVDTSTIEVVSSDDERFTESVRTALGAMRFRPAKRAGKPVRQLVEQKFHFRIHPTVGADDRVG